MGILRYIDSGFLGARGRARVQEKCAKADLDILVMRVRFLGGVLGVTHLGDFCVFLLFLAHLVTVL